MSSSPQFGFTINDQQLRAQLARLGGAVNPAPLLKIAGQHMRGSIERTFRDQGSPAGSWPPLAAWTKTGAMTKLSRRGGISRSQQRKFGTVLSENEGFSSAGIFGQLRGGRMRNEALRSGRLILIRSGRLKNSITQAISGNALTIGTNLIYARIHQFGGKAGRGHRATIPARPYLVFRPEDPEMIARKMEAYIAQNVVEGTA